MADHNTCSRDAEALALLGELLDAYIDARHQGSGSEPGSSPTWHAFISTWEEADELIPRVEKFLGRAGRTR